jgi:hypothetical protein
MAALAIMEGEAATISRKAVELALPGDLTAMRLVLERLVSPARDRPVQIELPAVTNAQDLVAAASALTQATTSGEITPAQAADLSQLMANVSRAIEVAQIDERHKAVDALLEAKN